MTYEYLDTVTKKILLVEQRITDNAFAWYDAKAKAFFHGMKALRHWHAVKRQISNESGGFQLIRGPSGGWSSDGYSPKPHERKAEKTLGRKLVKAAR